MKKNIYILTVILLFFTGCNQDELSDISVMKESQRAETPFDRWLFTNYIQPYNVEYKYRMEDIESDQNYNLTPARMDKSIQLAKIIDFLCFDVYDQITGSQDFIRTYFPKVIHVIGSVAYISNGNTIGGTAENGLKITLYNVNSLNPKDIASLNNNYLRIIHHEFTHILHQTKPFPTDLKKVTPAGYVRDAFSQAYPYPLFALKKGFITPYASYAVEEDMAEIVSTYITNTPEYWNKQITNAGTEGAGLINQKLKIIIQYFHDSWDIDLDKLRDNILKHQQELGTIDLNQL